MLNLANVLQMESAGLYVMRGGSDWWKHVDCYVACTLHVKPFFCVLLSDGSGVLGEFYRMMNVGLTNACSDANFIN